jgi:hypothetical protein
MTSKAPGSREFGDLREKLQSALPALKNAEPRRDLWPLMRQRILEGPPPVASSAVPWFSRVPWFDWALLGLAGAALILRPALILTLLYHL